MFLPNRSTLEKIGKLVAELKGTKNEDEKQVMQDIKDSFAIYLGWRQCDCCDQLRGDIVRGTDSCERCFIESESIAHQDYQAKRSFYNGGY